MYAADNLSDALQVTKRYLGSLGFAEYLKLALVVLCIGGLGLTNQLTSADLEPAITSIEELVGFGIELVLVALGVAIYVGFRYLAALLEFVFVESLRSEAMHVRSYARENLRQGLWLVLFRAGLWLVFLALVLTVVAAIVLGGNVTEFDDVTAGYILLAATTAFVAYVGLWIVYTLTTAFVVPVMLLEDRGPIGAWRRVAATLGENWTGALAFLFLAWVVGTMLAIAVAIIGIFAMLVGLFLFTFGFLIATEIDPALEYVVSALGILAFLGYSYALSLLEAPVRSYVRYYALLLLGDTDETLDLVPEQRAAVRADGRSAAGTDRPTAGSRREPTGWGDASDDEPATDASASSASRSSQWSHSSETTDATDETETASSDTESGTNAWGGDAVWDDSSGWGDSSTWEDDGRPTDDESPRDEDSSEATESDDSDDPWS